MYYPCARAASRSAEPNAKILTVGEQRSFYLDADALPTSVFQQQPVPVVAETSPDGVAMSAELRRRGFTHLLYVPNELKRLESYGVTEGLESPAWGQLLRHAQPVFHAPDCALLALP